MFRKQTAIRNQAKKPELTNRKKGNQDEADTIEGVVIDMNQPHFAHLFFRIPHQPFEECHAGLSSKVQITPLVSTRAP